MLAGDEYSGAITTQGESNMQLRLSISSMVEGSPSAQIAPRLSMLTHAQIFASWHTPPTIPIAEVNEVTSRIEINQIPRNSILCQSNEEAFVGVRPRIPAKAGWTKPPVGSVVTSIGYSTPGLEGLEAGPCFHAAYKRTRSG